MLDNLEYISRFDRSGMLDTISKLPEQIEQALEICRDIEVEAGEIENILISGMGGSAISGDIIREWLRDRADIPVHVNRDYNLPKWADEKTFAIFLSYSGNTEETLYSFREALERNIPCVAISSGGKLEEESREKNIPHIKIPSGYQPRAATPFLLFPSIKVLEKIAVIGNVDDEISETLDVCRGIREENRKETPSENNQAKNIALKSKDTLVHIYGWRYFIPIAKRWRTQINENSKMIARYDGVPECNHNDIVGWSRRCDLTEKSTCILLRDSREPVRIKERYSFMREIFECAGATVVEVNSKGENLLARQLSLMYVGDFVSCYLAILNEEDPTPVDVISRLKQKLASI